MIAVAMRTNWRKVGVSFLDLVFNKGLDRWVFGKAHVDKVNRYSPFEYYHGSGHGYTA